MSNISGHCSKVLVFYESAFWRDQGFSGEALCSSGPLCSIFDATTYEGQAALVGFIGGEQCDEWSAKPEKVRHDAIKAQLQFLFGAAALTPLRIMEKNWNLEPFAGGCPIASPRPGKCTDLALLRQTVFDNTVHFAGTETATKWSGFISGAVQTGIRAASEVAQNIGVSVHFQEEKGSALVSVSVKEAYGKCKKARHINILFLFSFRFYLLQVTWILLAVAFLILAVVVGLMW